MKINTKPRDDHQLTVNVEVEPERMEGARHRAARRIAERTKIPGFRPGKAPYDIVRRQVGDGAITEEAVELLVDQIYPEVLKEADIKPGAPGSLEKVESTEPPKFIFTIPLEPIVDLGDYRSIRLPYDWKEPGDRDVDEAIEEMRRMHATTHVVERAADAGDFVLIDVKGLKTKTTKEEAPVVDYTDFPVYIRPDDKKEDEFPFPGFSRQLIGLKAGESKSFTHKYAKDDKNEDLHGQTVNYLVTVKTIRGLILPELNDEFARTAGAFENVQALREAVHANLINRSKTEYENDYYVRLVDKIKEGAVIKYPPQTLEHEFEHALEDIQSRLTSRGLDLDAYLKSRQMEREKFFQEEVKPIAVRRLERSLILDEVAKIEKIKVQEQTFNTAFQQTYGEIQSSDSFQKFMRDRNAIPKRVLDAVAMESAGRAMTQEILQRLKDIALGQAPELPIDEKIAGKKAAAKSPTKTQKTGSRSKKSASKASSDKQVKISD